MSIREYNAEMGPDSYGMIILLSCFCLFATADRTSTQSNTLAPVLPIRGTLKADSLHNVCKKTYKFVQQAKVEKITPMYVHVPKC